MQSETDLWLRRTQAARSFASCRGCGQRGRSARPDVSACCPWSLGLGNQGGHKGHSPSAAGGGSERGLMRSHSCPSARVRAAAAEAVALCPMLTHLCLDFVFLLFFFMFATCSVSAYVFACCCLCRFLLSLSLPKFRPLRSRAFSASAVDCFQSCCVCVVVYIYIVCICIVNK